MSKEKQMKFYSEKLDKLFDTEDALKLAESDAMKSKKAKKSNNNVVIKETVKTETSSVPSKKQLAAEVDAAYEGVRKAYAEYEAVKLKVEELSKTYLEEINALLEPAKKAVKDAEKTHYEAIRKFNDSYGAYQVTYTGARAAEEMAKAMNNINSRANRFIRDLFWF